MHDAGPEAEAVSNAQWRGMQALAALCLAHGASSCLAPSCSPGPTQHRLLSAQLRWITATDTAEASAALHAPLLITDAAHSA